MLEVFSTEHDVSQTGTVRQIEVRVEHGPSEVEVDEHNPLASSSESDSKVGGRGRLALVTKRTREHDRACAAIEVHELEVRGQNPDALCLRGVRLGQHCELVPRPEAPRRLGQAPEEGNLEPIFDL